MWAKRVNDQMGKGPYEMWPNGYWPTLNIPKYSMAKFYVGQLGVGQVCVGQARFWPTTVLANFWQFSKQGGGETWSRKKKEEAGHEGEPSWHSSQLIHPMRRSQEKLGLGFVEREHPVGREGEPSRLGVAMCQDKRFHCCRCLWLKKRGILVWKPLGTYPCNHKTLGSWN